MPQMLKNVEEDKHNGERNGRKVVFKEEQRKD